MPDWFADQVRRMEQPALPAFDPGAAVKDGSAGGRSFGRERTNRGSSASDSVEDHPLSDVWGE